MKRAQTHHAEALKYAREVLSGHVPACKWVRLACQRHIDDLARTDWPYTFDPAKANKVCAFIQNLPHIKGEWGTVTIKLEPWQKFILSVVFGWVGKASGLRRFRTGYVEVPRKNAKSTLSTGIALYMLTEDGEAGAEVYSAATTRDQARIVFAAAQEMARRTPDLGEYYGLAVNAHNINVLGTGSKFEALSSEYGTLDGLNVHCGIIDELHAHRTREVYDVIETATGSRRQPLLWAITTAGSNRSGICYEQRDYTTKLLERTFTDETYFGIVYTIDDGDNWASEDSWKKANPNYGISVMPDDMHRLAVKALQMPSAVNNFLTKRLDVWVSADAGLFDMAAWDSCGDRSLKPEQFAGWDCYLGVDLGFVDDIAAAVKMFTRVETVEGELIRKYAFFGRYYLPEETVSGNRNSQYQGWERAARLTATDGNVTDTERIIDDMASDLERFQVKHICFDPYNKLSIQNPMAKRGVAAEVMSDFPQTVAKMSPATEGLMKAILSKTVLHDGDPVLTWALSNVVGHFDAKGNVYPKKEREENKIDPAIAAIMAFGVAMNAEPVSPYEERGVLSF